MKAGQPQPGSVPLDCLIKEWNERAQNWSLAKRLRMAEAYANWAAQLLKAVRLGEQAPALDSDLVKRGADEWNTGKKLDMALIYSFWVTRAIHDANTSRNASRPVFMLPLVAVGKGAS